jgi:mannose-6-phosphate isomerase-like protein (cupin superfamily)
VLWVLEGEGQCLKGDARPAPIKAGECAIVPRGAVHGIRNTGHGNLSYLAVTSIGGGGYMRDVAGH